MSFNPTIDPTSASMIFGGLNRQTDANERRAEEQRQQNQQNVATATSAIGKLASTAEELDGLHAKMDMFRNEPGPGGQPVIDEATWEKFQKGGIGAKREIASTAEAAFLRNMKQIPPQVSAIPGTDYFSVGNQVVPKAKPDVTPKSQATIHQAADGSFFTYDPTTSTASPILMNGKPVVGPQKSAGGDMFPAEPTGADTSSAATPAQLQQEIADLTGQITTRGADAKNGPNWNPFATSLGDQLKAKQAQLAALNGGGAAPAVAGSQPVGPAASPAPAAGGGYQPGKAYHTGNGQVLTYLGGDPSQPTSWR